MTARTMAPEPAKPPRRCETCYCWGLGMGERGDDRTCCGGSPANSGTLTARNWSCPSWLSKREAAKL